MHEVILERKASYMMLIDKQKFVPVRMNQSWLTLLFL